MHNGYKTALTVCLILALLGAGLVGVGIALGGKPNFRLDWKNRTLLAGDAELKTGETAPEPFTSIEIDVATADIEISVGDAFSVAYALDEEPVITQENGVFRLKEPPHSGISFIGITSGGSGAYVRVTVPEGTQLDSVDLDTSTGELIVSQVSCKTLTVDLSTGEAHLIAVTADQLTADSSTGSIVLTDCAVKDAKLDVSTGSIESERLTVTRSLRADASTGDVTLELCGRAADFGMNLESGTGDVTVDGKDRDDEFKSSGSIPLLVETSTGDIDVTFV